MRRSASNRPHPIRPFGRCFEEMSCIRCRQALWLDEDDFCAACAVAVRMEYRRGIRALETYLGRWADFADWLRLQEVPQR